MKLWTAAIPVVGTKEWAVIRALLLLLEEYPLYCRLVESSISPFFAPNFGIVNRSDFSVPPNMFQNQSKSDESFAPGRAYELGTRASAEMDEKGK